jgi:hypothetical protein
VLLANLNGTYTVDRSKLREAAHDPLATYAASGSPPRSRRKAALGRWRQGRGRIDEAKPSLAQARSTRLAPKHGDRVESDLLEAQLTLALGQLPQASRR